MHRYTLSPEARTDLIAIATFIADDNLAAAERWIEDITATLHRITRFPEMGRRRPEIKRGLRSLVRDGYVIYYRLRRAKHIEIVRVLEGHQDATGKL